MLAGRLDEAKCRHISVHLTTFTADGQWGLSEAFMRLKATLNYLHSPERADLMPFANALPPDAVLHPYLPTRVRMLVWVQQDLIEDTSVCILMRKIQRDHRIESLTDAEYKDIREARRVFHKQLEEQFFEIDPRWF